MMNLNDELDNFLKGDPRERSRWIYTDKVTLYTRKSRRYLKKQYVTCIDIADITVHEPHRGTGVFATFIQHVEQVVADPNNSFQGVFVESIVNPYLMNRLTKHGYTVRDDCCYKLIDKINGLR